MIFYGLLFPIHIFNSRWTGAGTINFEGEYCDLVAINLTTVTISIFSFIKINNYVPFINIIPNGERARELGIEEKEKIPIFASTELQKIRGNGKSKKFMIDIKNQNI